VFIVFFDESLPLKKWKYLNISNCGRTPAADCVMQSKVPEQFDRKKNIQQQKIPL